MQVDDAALLARWQRDRDPDAFAEIAKRHAGMVFSTAKRILRDAGDAEDVAQECFIELTRQRVRTSVGGWLYTAAVHRALNRLRSRSRRSMREHAYAQNLPNAVEPTCDELLHLADEAIAGLPERYRAPLVAHFFEGCTYEDVADALDIPKSTAAFRVRKGVELLRRALRRKGVKVPLGVLLSTLAQGSADAAPLTLSHALMKLALAGYAGPTASAVVPGLLGGVLLMKAKTALVAIILLLIAGAALYAWKDAPVAPAVPQPLARPNTSPFPLEILSAEPAKASEATPATPATIAPVRSTDEAPAAAQAAVSGHVLDREGKPIDGATVELAVLQIDGHREQVLATFATTAGKDGLYTLDSVSPAGNVRLTASAEGFVRLDSGSSHVYGSPRLQFVVAGERYENVDFRLAKAVGYLGGRVINAARVGLSGARVEVAKQLGPEDSQGWYYGISGEDGRFRIALPGEDVCVLIIRKEGYGAGYFTEIYPGMEDLELVLQNGGAVFGTVSATDGRPLSGVKVMVMGEKMPGNVEEEWEAPGTLETTTAPDGSYRVEDLSAAFTYTVRAPYPIREPIEVPATSRSLDDYLQRLENRARDVDELHFGTAPTAVMAEQTNVAVRAGQDTRVDLRAEQGGLLPSAIYGRVTDTATGKPVSPVQLYALCQDAGLDIPLIAMAATQRDGTYRMQFIGLPARLNLSIRVDYCVTGEERNFEEKPEVTSLQLGPGEERELNLGLAATVTAPVRTVNTEGAPIAGVVVRDEVSDAEGRLTLYGLEPNVTHILLAHTDRKDPAGHSRGTSILGRSASFVGKPGETVPEVRVVCNTAMGKVRGRILAPDVDLEEEPYAMCFLHYADGGLGTATLFLEPDGSFLADRISTGACDVELAINTRFDHETKRWIGFSARLPDVEILPDRVVDLGTVTLVSNEE